MERFGGGGHSNVAGAQLDMSKDEFFEQLKPVIKEMYESGEL